MHDEYTPTTAKVRDAYMDREWNAASTEGEEFDRWLADHDAEKWDEGNEAGMSNYSDARNGDGKYQTVNPYREESTDA